MNLINKFENIMVLRTLLNDIDLNFITVDDLDRIATTAYEDLGIDLNCIDLDGLYNDDIDKICDVYTEWFDDVNTMYLDVKNEISKKR